MARKVTNPSFKFFYDEQNYTVQGAESLAKTDMKALRAEYTRMRDVAQKRIKRLSEQFPKSKTFQSHQYGFAKLKNIDPRDLPKAFSELAKFLKAKSSTVSGQKEIREKSIASWREQGIEITSNEQYDMTIAFLEENRRKKKVYDSEKVAKAGELILSVDKANRKSWLANYETVVSYVDEISQIPGATSYSFDYIKTQLGF